MMNNVFAITTLEGLQYAGLLCIYISKTGEGRKGGHEPKWKCEVLTVREELITQLHCWSLNSIFGDYTARSTGRGG